MNIFYVLLLTIAITLPVMAACLLLDQMIKRLIERVACNGSNRKCTTSRVDR